MHPLPAVRFLTNDEMRLPIEWAAHEGWNPGRHDATAFHAADPLGFLVGEKEGKPVSTISAVRTGADFGFIGFYIVAPEHRGSGYGFAIWQAAMDRLAGRVIGLDGVIAQQANYRQSGFVLAHRNLRYGGIAPLASTPKDTSIVPVGSLRFDQIAAFDTAHFSRARPAFLQAWLALPDSQALARLRDGEVQGYGVIRRCREGCKIGPLFALNEADAEALFLALAAFAPGEPIFFDPPEPNPSARALAQRHGLTPVFETARMYRGPAPTLPLDRIYSITSFELG